LTNGKFSAPDEIPNLLLYHKFAAFSNFQRSRHVMETQLLQLLYDKNLTAGSQLM
jgi:hypothetical protein